MADISNPVIVRSPIVHTCGSNCFIIHPETDADQVMVSETTRLSEQLETINRAIAGSSAIRFTSTIAERNLLTNILPGDRVWVYNAQEDPDVGTSIPAMYIWTPEKVWKRVGEAAAINIKDFIEEGAGIETCDNKLTLAIDDTMTLTSEGRVGVRNPMWNTRETITESCEWDAPVTGWYKLTLIGGSDGCKGSIDTHRTIYGGRSGFIAETMVYMEKGSVHNVTVGAGGTGTTKYSEWSSANNGGLTSFDDITAASLGAEKARYPGVGNGVISHYSNKFAQGYGGGLGGGIATYDQNGNYYGAGGGGLIEIDAAGNITASIAGDGKHGCVIAEYYDPAKDADAGAD